MGALSVMSRYAVSYPPKVVRAPPFDGIVQEPLTQRQGGSGMHGKLDTSPCVLSVYYRLVRISLVWSDTTSYQAL